MGLLNRIVALFEPSAALAHMRWRMGLAAMLLLMMGAWPLILAFSEPSLGIRFLRINSQSLEIVATRADSALKQPLLAPQAILRTENQSHMISSQELLETAGVETFYAKQRAYHAAHEQYWQSLQHTSLQLEAAGSIISLSPSAKQWSELGPRFWIPWCVGLLSLAVALAVWLFSPNRQIAALYLGAACAFNFIMAAVAISSSRLLTVHPDWWADMLKLTHLTAYIQNICLCMILWLFPKPLGHTKSTRLFLSGLIVWAAVWLTIDWLEFVETIAIGFRLPTAATGLIFIALLTCQWRQARGHLLHRSQLKWLMLMFGLSYAAVFAAYVYALQPDIQVDASQAYAFVWMAVMYVGIIPLATRLKMFALEAWWVRVWAWLLGGLLVILLDIGLLWVVHMPSNQALLVAMALAGWLYFPIRQWLWVRIMSGRQLRVQDYLPQVLRLVTHEHASSNQPSTLWHELWETVFEPSVIHPMTQSNHASVQIQDLGQSLFLPVLGDLPALRLDLAKRGTRLFNSSDVKLAHDLYALVQSAIQSRQAFQRGAATERQRIAADLHDDLGARLLSLSQSASSAQSSPNSTSTADMARQALDDMRLSVRGMTAQPALAELALADWRGEIMQRLQTAGLQAEWEAAEPPPDLLLGARLQVQFTRILREAVSNLIRHAHANHCRVELHISEQDIVLNVHDDGRGLPQALLSREAGNQGHGLLNIERRAHNLGGRHLFATSPMGGALISVSIPIRADSQPMPLQ